MDADRARRRGRPALAGRLDALGRRHGLERDQRLRGQRRHAHRAAAPRRRSVPAGAAPDRHRRHLRPCGRRAHIPRARLPPARPQSRSLSLPRSAQRFLSRSPWLQGPPLQSLIDPKGVGLSCRKRKERRAFRNLGVPQPKGSPGKLPQLSSSSFECRGREPQPRPLALHRRQALLLASALGHLSKRQLRAAEGGPRQTHRCDVVRSAQPSG